MGTLLGFVGRVDGRRRTGRSIAPESLLLAKGAKTHDGKDEGRGGRDREAILALIEAYLTYCYTHRTAARVTELASFAGLDRSWLGELMRRTLGVSPREAMHDLQVRRARILVIESDLTNEEIALSSGFGTRNTFERVFAQYCEISPAQYRQRHSPK